MSSGTSSLPRKLKKAADFFKSENLAALTLKYEGEVALLVIDVQKEFCDPKERRGTKQTKAVSKHIRSIVPQFRKAGIPVYAVYNSPDGERKPSDIDFYKFAPGPNDVVIAKNGDSAFKNSNIGDILKKDHKKLLLICGFNLSVCVAKTALDARASGFEVCLLRDLTADDYFCSDIKYNTYTDAALREMQQQGVVIAPSKKILKYLPRRRH